MKRLMMYALLALTSALWTGCATKDARSLVKPKALEPGDTIAFVAPARHRNIQGVETAAAELERRGYKVLWDETVTTPYKNLSAPDEDRAARFMAAFEDPEVDAVFPVTGGYGTTRMIDQLDYDLIRANPKMVIGYSDITGLHLAMLAKAGMMSFHSPFPTYMYLERDTPEEQEEYDEQREYLREMFWSAVEAEAYEERGEEGWLIKADDSFTTPVTTMVPGRARGRLTGGNLSLVHAVSGSPYEMQTDGMILFFEDIGEAPYRIDRMLSNLELDGHLENPAGVILGHFRNCETDNPERNFTLEEVFRHYFEDRDYPVVMNFPVGHVVENATFPVGAMAELDADAGTLRILENPVRLP